MIKVDYAVIVAISLFSVFLVYKRKNKNHFKQEGNKFEETNRFEEEILNLENAVKCAVNKISK